MSNFIPMVSSSPPPLDDGGGFDDWDEDFGNFMGADENVSIGNGPTITGTIMPKNRPRTSPNLLILTML